MPRPSLREALATPERKHRYVARLFDTIADDYDFITRLLSYGRDQHWKRRLIALAAIQPHERVLDLACGTGDLAFASAATSPAQTERPTSAQPWAAETVRAEHLSTVTPSGPFVVGLDFTPRMVQLARARERAATTESPVTDFAPADERSAVDPAASARTGRRVKWLVGDMMALPFPSNSFDVITTGYGFRNVPVLDEAIREAARVLRPGGRLLSLDFNRPQPPVLRAVYLTYLTIVGSTVGLALHRDPDTYRYIPESIRRYPGAAAVVDRLRAAGFGEARWIPVLGGLMAIHVATR